MKRSSGERGEGRIGCFLWVLLAGLIIYVGYVILPVRFAASRFYDLMAEEAAFGSQKGNWQILEELVNFAKEQELPIAKEQIEITRTRESITIAVHYEVTLKFLGIFSYVWRFDPIVARPLVST